MNNRLLLLGLLAFIVAENGLLLYFGSEVRQVRAEMTVLQQQVAQLRVWRASLGSASPTAAASPDSASAPASPAAGPAPLLARVLAGLVVLRQAAKPLEHAQLDRLHRHLDVYEGVEQPAQQRLAEESSTVLNSDQRAYLESHARQVDAKADELVVETQRDESTYPVLLKTFLREAGAHL